jgi:hypothetical protein
MDLVKSNTTENVNDLDTLSSVSLKSNDIALIGSGNQLPTCADAYNMAV